MPHFDDNLIDMFSKDYFSKRLSTMKKERESFIPHYKELQQFIKPRRGRFFTQDRNKGERKQQSIINSVATQAHQIARAGMYTGIMSPARPWFALSTFNKDLMEIGEVKLWLHQVQKILLEVFNAGNLYDMAPVLIGEMLMFGTGCIAHVDDFEDVSRFYTQTAGSFMIAQNERYVVDTVAREFEMTASQMVSKFGREQVSTQVLDNYLRGNYDAWHPVIQFVEPNPHADPRKLQLKKFKPFRSVYYEQNNTPSDADRKKFLEFSGFDEFPLYCPRWDVTGEDIYGTDCPAMTALGDIKGLQIEEKRKAQAIDKMVNPPLGGPPSLRNVPVQNLPGGVSIYSATGSQKLQPIYQVNPNLGELRLDMQEVENRIKKAFYVDMFLAISDMQGIQPKNQLELSQRNEERLLQLGPTLQRFQRELLDPMINRTFNQSMRARMLPPPPEQLQGSPLKIQYISTLAMAQQAIATQDIDRLTMFVGGLMNMGFEDARYKFDSMQAVDEYGTAMGVPPRLIVPDKEAKERQQADIAAAQAAQQAESLAQMAGGVKDLAGAETDRGNALDAMSDAVQGG